MNRERIRLIKSGAEKKGPVIYWMSREQRVHYNWSLLNGQHMAMEKKAPLLVIFCLTSYFLNANIRHYGFMLKGLEELQEKLSEKNIPFFLLSGSPEKEIPKFINEYGGSIVVTDFDPLRIKRQWKQNINISVPFYEVDSHNIIPCWISSSKQEYGAYTIRPKIKKILPGFLDKIPLLEKHPYKWNEEYENINIRNLMENLNIDKTVTEITRLASGENAAKNTLKEFIKNKLNNYTKERNDPNRDGISNLSPYLHFGQISPQNIAMEIYKSDGDTQSKDAFLEELIVRRELSDNFCYYNHNYDTFEGFPLWAQKTLNDHRQDERTYIYKLGEFEDGKTHDDLWNAAQMEMVKTGKMHGYMRMYWGKKILEWTETPEEAIKTAIYLNDKYELDGRDPNGYTGIAWSIGGVHDRAWGERAIFGKIRYMSYNGCKSKFNIRAYIEKNLI